MALAETKIQAMGFKVITVAATPHRVWLLIVAVANSLARSEAFIRHRISFCRKTQSVYIQTDLPICFTS